MLHGQQGLADGHVADQLDEAFGFALAHAGGGLVEQDQVGTAGDRDADFQRTPLGIGEVHRQHVAALVELDHFEDLLGAVVGIVQVGQELPEGIAVAQAPQQRTADVLEHRQPREQVGDLEAASQAEAVDLVGLLAVDALAVQMDLARGGRKAAADQVEQRALAGAVGPDDGDALAGLHGQLGAADDLALAEVLAQVAQFEGIAAHRASRRLISFSMSSWISPHWRA
mmetsp:Transcript_54949/g.134445  ORF Transcript_54949/g.134445 Transcript_54949/m.134445 type:complete len:227 (-) Transcript_54949:147-827(-)